MKLTFYGAAGEVTGSRHLLEADGLRLLLDCGFFQGHRHEAIDKNKQFPFRPKELDAVLLSHAHIDHSGGLPLLAKAGFDKAIHCTPATKDLCGIMLMDAAHIQESDAEFFNKIHQKDGQTIEPLFTEEDAKQALSLLESNQIETEIPLGPKARARFHNAGHVLGSAMIQVELDSQKGRRRVLFTGDLGRRRTLLMEPPAIPKNVDYLLIESTYGDRVHDPISHVEEQLKKVIDRAAAEKSKILIPSFALERTQEIIFVIEKLLREKAIAPIPVYVDSPMAVNITEVFGKHLDSFSFAPDFMAYVAKEGDPFGFQSVHYVRTSEESQRLNDLPGPMIIISASGMCEGGRILHHLRNNIDKETTTILIVGYQAQGTLGRRLAEGARKVKIFGLEHEVWARVEIMHTFSGHADKADLMWFIGSLDPRPRRIFLVHGDPQDRQALVAHLKAEGIDRVECPEFGDSYDLD